MKRALSRLALALTLGVCVAASAAAPRELSPAIAGVSGVAAGHGDAPRSAWPGGVTALADLTYATLIGYRPLKLDLYLPPRARTPAPLIVYVHGGAWNQGNPRSSGAFADFPAALAEIAARGYAVASVSYRFSSEARYPAALQDVKSALRWLRANAGRWRIDRTRAVVWGASSGGQLAALVGVSCGLAELSPPSPVAGSADDECVQGVIAWFGVFDFTNPPPAPAPGQPGPDFRSTSAYLGCPYPDCPPETLRLASPQRLIDRAPPPFLLVHGERDRAVSARQSLDFGAALRAAGGAAEVLVIPDVDHGFIGATPAATRDASLLAIRRTFAFIERTIGTRR